MSLKQLKDVTYFKLNNEINIPVNGSIPLAKDKEAITAFFKENYLLDNLEIRQQNGQYLVYILIKISSFYHSFSK